jgi:GNAT superfamily N-acetyltransferase
MLAVFDAAHGYADDATRRMYGPALLDGLDVEAWLAWDGDEPISCVYVTRVGDSLGVFDMNTAPAHRRRGAGRAVLTAALHAVATRLDRPPSVCFWSTPLGRPMYESIGFVVIDDVEVWTLGASDQDMDAVGAG